MKTFIYILATLCTCNAKLQFSLGGSDEGSIKANLIGVGGGHASYYGAGAHGPQIIKVILQEGHGGGGGYVHSTGGGHAQIYKVITQTGGGHSDAHAYSHGGSYGAHGGHSSHGGSSHSSLLQSILPQILELILKNDGGHGSVNQQLVSEYGHEGSAIVKRQGKLSSRASYFNSGHVVEKGDLHIMRVEASAHAPSVSSSGWWSGWSG